MSEAEHQREDLLAGESKAAIRRRLPSLLEQGRRGGIAATTALRACCAVGVHPPLELLTAENIQKLPLEDMLRMLFRLGEMSTVADYSTVLEALRAKASDANPSAPALNALSRQIASRLLKISGKDPRSGKASKASALPSRSEVRFTLQTRKSAVSLAEWLIKVGSESWRGRRGAENACRTAALWLKAIEAIVPGDTELESLAAVLRLWRRLPSMLPASAQVRLANDERASAYIKGLRAQVLDRIEPALLHGRIDELQRLLDLAESDPELRAPILSGLRESGVRRLLELPTGVSEWLAGSIQEPSGGAKTVPKPADESQSAALESVAACLLSAWDSTAEPARAPETLRALRALAHDLFKVDLIGRVGEVVKFDARQHEASAGRSDFDAARIVRPGVVWSNGLRSRVIIRALVERQI